MSESKAFKDWFDRKAAAAIAAQMRSVHRTFDVDGYVQEASRGLGKLEMMDRVRQFAAALRTHLPQDVPRALQVLEKSLPPPLPDCEAVTDGWLQWPVGQFIAEYATEHYHEAIKTMHALTQRFSSEFAIRPFVQRYPDDVFADFARWTRDPSPHVRRWCSEGIRPRLPWGKRLDQLVSDPAPIIPILDALKDDSELYVRRSVANCLNDVAKDHPALVLDVLESWREGTNDKRDWVIRNAARSLLKSGDRRALALLGFHPPKSLRAALTIHPESISIGDAVELRLEVDSSSRTPQQLMIDFVVHYPLANGKTGPKVFKWAQKEVAQGLRLTKKLTMKPTTIRTLRSGVHRVEVQINGVRMAESDFQLNE